MASSEDVKTSILNIKDVPYICRGNPGDEGCGDMYYWENIIKGVESVPSLIELIDDNTSIEVPVPNFGGDYTVGDIAIFQMSRIDEAFPLETIIKNSIGYRGGNKMGGFWYYWKFVRESQANRMLLKEEVKKWWNP